MQGGFVAKIWKSPAGPLEGGIYLNRRPERSRFETLAIPSSEIGSGAPQSFSQTGSPIPRLIMCCKRGIVYYIHHNSSQSVIGEKISIYNKLGHVIVLDSQHLSEH